MTIVKTIELSLPSNEIADTFRFYTEVFGFKPVWEFSDFCSVKLGCCLLTFFSSEARFGSDVFGADQRSFLLIDIDGIEQLFDRVSRAGISSIVHPLKAEQPGTLEFTARDNNGYQISFVERGIG